MSERTNDYSRWPADELFVGAERGFDAAYAYAKPDADVVRAEAASVFELAAGEKILADLENHGITLDQLDRLPYDELERIVQLLAPGAMREVLGRICLLDNTARDSLGDKAYDTLRENGLTQND